MSVERLPISSREFAGFSYWLSRSRQSSHFTRIGNARPAGQPGPMTSAAFAAEQPLVLVPEPKNKYDPNAIAVWSADRRTMAGYVPRDDAAWATNWMNRTRQPLYAIVTTEFIDRQTHQRTGLRMLLAPQPIVIAKP